MSIRHARKLMGDSLPAVGDNSDEDYEPLYAKKVTNHFKGLEISSHSDEDNYTGEEDIEHATGACKKKNKKKKKKQRKSRNIQNEPSTSKINIEELDEIDKSILEVNAILGEPINLPSGSAQSRDPSIDLMVVSAKYLNATEEMNRLFGPEDDETKKRQRQCQYKLMKRAIILPPPENNYVIRFNNGISMSILRKANDVTYFAFEHSREYQKILRSLIALYTQWDGPMSWFPEELNGPKALVEEILHKIDTMFYVEEYSIANTMVEQCIAHLQSVVHLSFNVTNRNTRLEYKIRENRVFHILLLKYLYLLTNKACHRTSLEVAKIMLNLDPSDPMAVVLIVDTLAIRAREYQWLVDAVEVWSRERSAGLLFNIQYSHSLAHFHLISRRKGDLTVADRFLQNAMIRFPSVVLKIFEACSTSLEPRIANHPLFRDAGETTKNLQDLIELYARFSWSRWKEAPVLKWLTRNVYELVEKFNANMLVKELTDKLANKRQNLFQSWPTEIIRHLTVISSMSKLLVDGAVPHVDRGNAFDPVPPADGIDRYSYRTATRFDYEPMRNNVLYELFASLIPTYQNPREPDP